MEENHFLSLVSLVFFLLSSLSLLLIFLYTPKFVGFLVASVYINSPPVFNHSNPINNITLKEDSSKFAFNIYSHFFDPDGNDLTLKMFGNHSTYVEVDENNNVTIKTRKDFNGVEIAHFLVDDGVRRNASSNNVTINVTKVTDIYSNFKGSNFSEINISNPFNLTLYNQFGKINFTVRINFSEKVERGEDINLTKDVNISFNRIEVNSTSLPELNAKATLTFYNLTFINPRILKDGNICSEPSCSIVSYKNGVLIFNVSGFDGFTVYYSEETPGITAQVAATSAGGGAAKPIQVPVFSIDKNELKVSLEKGTGTKEFLKIKNNLNKKIIVILDVSSLKSFIVSREKVLVLTLFPGEERLIELNFFAPSSIQSGVYTGSIILTAEQVKKEIPVIVEVSSREKLFDISLEVLKDFREITPGENIEVIVNVSRTSDVKANVLVELIIQDFNNTIISKTSRLIFVDNPVVFTEKILVPSTISIGKYLVVGKIIFNNQESIDSTTFYVVEKKIFGLTYSAFLILVVTFSIILMLAFISLIILNLYNLLVARNKDNGGSEKSILAFQKIIIAT